MTRELTQKGRASASALFLVHFDVGKMVEMKIKGNCNGKNMLLQSNIKPRGVVKQRPQARPGDFDESESTYPLTWV